MIYAVPYIAILVVFMAVDAVWLSTMGAILYRPTLGDILLPTLKITPAIAFYLIYPIGLLVFATLPALRAGSVMPALMYGALFGFVAYATYDLTNYATLRNWTLQITLLDLAWGAFMSAMASAAGFYAGRWVSAAWA